MFISGAFILYWHKLSVFIRSHVYSLLVEECFPLHNLIHILRAKLLQIRARRLSCQPSRFPLSGLAILKNICIFAKYDSCYKCSCVWHVLGNGRSYEYKNWLQDTYVQGRIENTEREKCDVLPFLELHVQTMLPWADYQGICLVINQDEENSGLRGLFNQVRCVCRQIHVWKLPSYYEGL